MICEFGYMNCFFSWLWIPFSFLSWRSIFLFLPDIVYKMTLDNEVDNTFLQRRHFDCQAARRKSWSFQYNQEFFVLELSCLFTSSSLPVSNILKMWIRKQVSSSSKALGPQHWKTLCTFFLSLAQSQLSSSLAYSVKVLRFGIWRELAVFEDAIF